MRCRECPAAIYNPNRHEFQCRCTGTTVRISARGCWVMPLLGLRDRSQSWFDGDDDHAICPRTLNRLIGNPNGKQQALDILRQIEERGELDYCLNLYPEKVAEKLRALMLAEQLRLTRLQRAVV